MAEHDVCPLCGVFWFVHHRYGCDGQPRRSPPPIPLEEQVTQLRAEVARLTAERTYENDVAGEWFDRLLRAERERDEFMVEVDRQRRERGEALEVLFTDNYTHPIIPNGLTLVENIKAVIKDRDRMQQERDEYEKSLSLAVDEYRKCRDAASATAQSVLEQASQHAWTHYMNGTFCTRCGTRLGSGQGCR